MLLSPSIHTLLLAALYAPEHVGCPSGNVVHKPEILLQLLINVLSYFLTPVICNRTHTPVT